VTPPEAGRAEPDGNRACDSTPPAAFIVGVTRSGTTLLRLMLDAHPELAIPPETHFIPELAAACEAEGDARRTFLRVLTAHERWPDFRLDRLALAERLAMIDPFETGAALRAFYALYAQRFGKPRWSDKTPVYVHHMTLIQRLLPESHFIHLIRDGRDAAVSIMERAFGPDSFESAARLWVERIEAARRQQSELRHYLEIRYEELVRRPRPVLTAVCRFLDLPWNDAMLHYFARSKERLAEIDRTLINAQGHVIVTGEERLAAHRLATGAPDPDRIGRWRTLMTAGERESYERIAGPLLRELGYDV
jgi:hypothetical protein